MGIFPSLSKRRILLTKKVFSLVLLLGLIVQPIAPSLFMSGFFISKAQAADESTAAASVDEEDVVDEAEEVEAESVEEVAPTEEATTPEVATEEVVAPESETSEAIEGTNTEEKTEETAPVVEEVSVWKTEGDKAVTTGPVELGVKYEAPQNKEVTVTFTKLPETPGTLAIEEITLTPEQIAATGSLSDKAYDITSSMENGSFEYELTLPIPEGKDNVQVLYADDVDRLKDAETVKEEDVKTEGDSIKAELDHFTVFIVTYTSQEFGGLTWTPDRTNPTGGWTATPDQLVINVHGPSANPVAFYKTEGVKADLPSGKNSVKASLYIDPSWSSVSNVRAGLWGEVSNGIDIGYPIIEFTNESSNPRIRTWNTITGVWVNSSAPISYGDNVDLEVLHNPFSNRFEFYVNGVLIHSYSSIDGADNYNQFEGIILNSFNNGTTYTTLWSDLELGTASLKPLNSTNVTITGNTSAGENQLGWFFNRDAGTTTPFAFDTDRHSIGNGAAHILPISSNPSDKFIAEYFAQTKVGDIESFSYDFNIGAGGSVSDADQFYLNVYANFASSSPTKFYDCRYSVIPASGIVGAWTTVTFDPTKSYSFAQRFDSPATCPSIPADMGADAVIRAFAINVGDTSASDAGLDGYIDNVVFTVADNSAAREATIFDFEATVPDTTAPAVPALVSPASGVYRHTTGPGANKSDWTDVTDPSGPVTYWYESSFGTAVDGNGEFVTKAYGPDDLSASEIDNPWEPEGTYYWHVKACDAVGNCSAWSPSWQINIDNTAPTVPSITAPTAEQVFPTQPILNQWTAASDAYGVHHYQVAYIYDDGHTFSGSTCPGEIIGGNAVSGCRDEAGTSRNHSPSLSEQGGVTIYVRALDAAGNASVWSSPVHYYYNTDVTAPSVPVHESPTDNSFQNFNTFTFQWTDVADAVEYEFQSSQNPAVDGNGVLTTGVWNNKAHGAPDRDYLTDSEIPSYGANGTWYWQVRAKDAAGNWSAWTAPWKLTIDMVAPVTTDSGTDANWHNAPVTVTLTCGDVAGSGCKTTYYTTDGSTPTASSAVYTSPIVISTGGITTIKYFSVDNAGNVETVKTAANPVKIDTTKAVTEVLSPAEYTYFGNPVTINIRSTDNESGIAKAVANYYNSSNTLLGTCVNQVVSPTQAVYNFTCTINPASLSTGTYYIKTNTINGAGTTSNTVTWHFNIDKTKPVTTVLNPANNSSQNAPFSINIESTDGGSGIVLAVANLYNSSNSLLGTCVNETVNPAASTHNFTCNIDTNTLSDGGYYIKTNARDAVNNLSNTVTWNFVVDKTVPSSTITTFGLPDGGTEETSTWDGVVAGTATDGSGSGINRVDLEITYTPFGGGPATIQNVTASGTTNWSYDVGDPAEGTYQVVSHAVDNAGNVESTYTITIVYDKTIPEVSLTIDPSNPNGDSNWYVTEPVITLTANDNYNVDYYIEYQLNGTGGAWTTYTGPVTIADGTWQFYYRSVDTVGNVSGIGVKNVKVDTQDPDEVNGLDAEYREQQDDIKLDWNVDDNDIDKVYIYRGGSRNFNINSGNKVAENDANDETYSDNNPDFGETYYYKLVSIDEAGNRSGARVIKVEMPENEGGTATVTDEGTDAATEGEVLGVETTDNAEGTSDQGGTVTEDGSVLGATDENGDTNGIMDFIKKYSWWWLIILLIIGYTSYRYYVAKKENQNPLV